MCIAIFGSLFPRKNISHCWLNMNAKIEKNQFNEAMKLIYSLEAYGYLNRCNVYVFL